jgi:hypothetical protein
LFASASLTAFQPDKYADALIVAGWYASAFDMLWTDDRINFFCPMCLNW